MDQIKIDLSRTRLDFLDIRRFGKEDPLEFFMVCYFFLDKQIEKEYLGLNVLGNSLIFGVSFKVIKLLFLSLIALVFPQKLPKFLTAGQRLC